MTGVHPKMPRVGFEPATSGDTTRKNPLFIASILIMDVNICLTQFLFRNVNYREEYLWLWGVGSACCTTKCLVWDEFGKQEESSGRDYESFGGDRRPSGSNHYNYL